MILRNTLSFLAGMISSALVLFVLLPWWHDTKSGVKSVEVPAALTQNMEQVEKMDATHQQLKATAQINEEAYIKQWAAFEKRLKQLEIQLAAQMAILNQYKNQHEVMVASQPRGQGAGRAERGGTPQASNSLPAPQLVQLAKEVGFTKVEVKP